MLVNNKGYKTPITSKTKSFVTITSNWMPPVFVKKTSIQDTAGFLNPILNHEQKLLKNNFFLIPKPLNVLIIFDLIEIN